MLRQTLFGFVAAAAIIGALPAAPAFAGPATPPARLEAFLDYPFVSGLTPAEPGNRIAWIETRKGLRNVWVAEGPDFHPRRLTDGTADDGMELGELNFSP